MPNFKMTAHRNNDLSCFLLAWYKTTQRNRRKGVIPLHAVRFLFLLIVLSTNTYSAFCSSAVFSCHALLCSMVEQNPHSIPLLYLSVLNDFSKVFQSDVSAIELF